MADSTSMLSLPAQLEHAEYHETRSRHQVVLLREQLQLAEQAVADFEREARRLRALLAKPRLRLVRS